MDMLDVIFWYFCKPQNFIQWIREREDVGVKCHQRLYVPVSCLLGSWELMYILNIKFLLLWPFRTHLDTCRPTAMHIHRYTPHVRLTRTFNMTPASAGKSVATGVLRSSWLDLACCVSKPIAHQDREQLCNHEQLTANNSCATQHTSRQTFWPRWFSPFGRYSNLSYSRPSTQPQACPCTPANQPSSGWSWTPPRTQRLTPRPPRPLPHHRQQSQVQTELS